MLRLVMAAVCLLFSECVLAQYWQQRTEYKIDVDFDHENHRYTGSQSIVYFNNSPDQLEQAFFHLYFNAFQPGSAMDVRSRNIEDPDNRVGDRIYNLLPDEIGYLHVKTLLCNGRPAVFIENETILEVKLPEPIAAGSKVVFEVTFEGQVPVQIRRSGRNNKEGIDYSMSQWYPKICEYDCRGWHANPYIAREFYGVWGDFEVNITINKQYIVAATGVLSNESKSEPGVPELNSKKGDTQNENRTWKWIAKNVHDFVWAADPDFVHERKQVPFGPMLHFYYQNSPDYSQAWIDAQPLIVKSFEFLSRNFGAYPYADYSIIQGGDGGMEYPMATLVTGNRKLPSLVGVIVHEIAHSWYQGVLGFDESYYYWMDEGFTSYIAQETMDHLFRSGLAVDHSSAYMGYYDLVSSGKEEALSTHADHFNTNYAYGNAAYSKGEVYLCQLAYIIGEDNFNAGLKKFYEEWKFRHPDANALLRTFEKLTGMELAWYNDYFVKSTHTIDYSIRQLQGSFEQTNVILERKGQMPMPIDLVVNLKDGSKLYYYIPLDLMRGEKITKNEAENWVIKKDWKWVEPYYMISISVPPTAIQSVEIDPSGRMADVNKENNKVNLEEGMNLFFDSE